MDHGTMSCICSAVVKAVSKASSMPWDYQLHPTAGHSKCGIVNRCLSLTGASQSVCYDVLTRLLASIISQRQS